MRVAAFDLGTNTTLCAVVEQGHDGNVVVLGDRAIVTGLGRGAAPELAMQRIGVTLDAIAELAAWARSLGAETFAAVGTSALRDAPNRDALLEPVRALIGGPADAITGVREAHLTYRGARFGLGVTPDELTVIDVGGGSTELVRGRGDDVISASSLDLGAVRLTERWLRSDPPSTAERARAVADIDRAIDAAPSALLHETLRAPLLLLAGSATNLAALALGIPTERVAEVVGRRVSAAHLFAAAGRIVESSIATRRSLPGIERGREDTIGGGALLLARLVERAGAEDVLIGDGGVRFGLALELGSASRP